MDNQRGLGEELVEAMQTGPSDEGPALTTFPQMFPTDLAGWEQKEPSPSPSQVYDHQGAKENPQGMLTEWVCSRVTSLTSVARFFCTFLY